MIAHGRCGALLGLALSALGPARLGAQTVEVVQRLQLAAFDTNATLQTVGTGTAVSRRAKVRLLYGADDRRDVFERHWSLKINYTVSFPASGNSTPDSLTIHHDADTDVYEALRIYPLTGTTVSLTINGVTPINAANLPTNIVLELIVETTPVYAFSATARPSLTVGGSRVSWAAVPGGREYELEWVFIDSAAGAGPSDPFERKMATRVVTESLYVQVDSAYPAGTVSYRVRAVGRHATGGMTSEARRPGAWSSRADFSTRGPKNFARLTTWQLALAFGEHGRKGATLTYFDGLSRKRQVLSPSLADTATLVAETKYDFEGRPVLEILPAPRAGTALNYANAFSRTTTGAPFTAEHFNDGKVDSLGPSAGAGRYYSSSNDFPGIHASYVPDAEGFPYRITEYTRDNTGRVRRTSGVGAALRLGNTHDEQFQYGTASSTELQRLFGSNAGTGAHYQRNLRRDPNGQGTVAYIDDRSRLVATALAGEPPLNLIALQTSRPDSFGVNISDNNTIDPSTGERLSVTRILNTEPGPYDFTYSLTGVDYRADGASGALCPSCVYEVTIQIINAYGRAVMLYTSATDSVPALVREIRNATPPACTEATGASSYGPQVVRFTAQLRDLSEYTVTKRLRLTAGALDLVASTASSTAVELTQGGYRNAARSEVDSAACALTCEENCDAATSTTAEMNACIEACAGFVNVSITRLKEEECRILDEQVLADVSPGGYLWEDDEWLKDAADLPNDRALRRYRMNWRSSWADDLKREHPEFCHAQNCRPLMPSEIYDAQMAAIGSYETALEQGYLNPVRMNPNGTTGPLSGSGKPDPYFLTVSAQAPFGGSLLQEMRDTLEVFVRNSDNSPYQSLWQFASDPANYFDDDCPANPDDCSAGADTYAGELPPPDDYKWRVFRSAYLGLKKRFHARLVSDADGPKWCPYWNHPNAHVVRPDTFATADDVEQAVDDGITAYCTDLCPLRAAEWVQSLKASCSTLTPETARQVDSLLSLYCQGACGLENPWALLTKEALAAGDPILAEVQRRIQPCSLDSIAVPSPYETTKQCNMNCSPKKEGEAPHECIKELLDLLNRHLPATGDRVVNLESDTSRFALCIPESLELARFRGSSISFGANSTASDCTITFYDSRGTVVPNDRIERIEGSQYAQDPPPNVPLAVAAQFQHVSVTAKVGGVQQTLFLYSTCTFPATAPLQECTVAQRPTVCAAEVFELYDAYVHRSDGQPAPRFLKCFLGSATRANQALRLLRSRPTSPAAGERRMRPSPCVVILARENGAKIDPQGIADFGEPVPVADVPPVLPSTVDGVPFARAAVHVTLTDGTSVVTYLFSDCGIAFEDDCETVSEDIDFPEAPLTPPDQCLTNLQEEADVIADGRLERDRMQLEEDSRTDHVDECFGRHFNEVFTYARKSVEHHYVLHYYDQAGNLLQTVPPAGVSVLSSTQLAAGAQPQHRLVSSFAYNSLNQPLWQHTPDGDTTRFWYNKAGQLRLTQDPDQRAASKHSFSRYDAQGRVVETGVVLNLTTANLSRVSEPSFPSAAEFTLTEVIRTVYDVAEPTLCAVLEPQENLRGHVAALLVEPTEGEVSVATCYSYDPHGIVKSVVQNIAGLGSKRLDYEYDLAGRHVTALRYQAGAVDQMNQRYEYDNSNRLLAVYSSVDGELWERDAHYRYYVHGPLARLEIGPRSVQGLDYVYTVQGWLKGVNGSTLTPGQDPGLDGETGASASSNVLAGRDVFGLTIGYFEGDYAPSAQTVVGTRSFESATVGSGLNSHGSSLYDGNIRHQVAALAPFVQNAGPIGSSYKYDQVSRLLVARTHQNLITASNAWSADTSTSGAHELSLSYDENSNLVMLRRGAANSANAIDDLVLHYDRASGNLRTNRLLHVDDAVPDSAHVMDIDDQGTFNPAALGHNYSYDRRGNLIGDNAGGIDSIGWTADGRPASITKTTGHGPNLTFLYDGTQQRAVKIIQPHGKSEPGWLFTYYVRDAAGGLIATYNRRIDTLGGSAYRDVIRIRDHTLGGSRRLGLRVDSTVTNTAQYTATVSSDGRLQRDLGSLVAQAAVHDESRLVRLTGHKRYELTDHLGSVMAVVSDRKAGHDSTANAITDYYKAELITAQDFDELGSKQLGRQHGDSTYRVGYQGKESDREVAGGDGFYNFGARVLDTRLGRWLSVDPAASSTPGWSPYNLSLANPVRLVDPTGAYAEIADEAPKTGDVQVHIMEEGRTIEAFEALGAIPGSPITGMCFGCSAPPPIQPDFVPRLTLDPARALENIGEVSGGGLSGALTALSVFRAVLTGAEGEVFTLYTQGAKARALADPVNMRSFWGKRAFEYFERHPLLGRNIGSSIYGFAQGFRDRIPFLRVGQFPRAGFSTTTALARELPLARLGGFVSYGAKRWPLVEAALLAHDAGPLPLISDRQGLWWERLPSSFKYGPHFSLAGYRGLPPLAAYLGHAPPEW